MNSVYSILIFTLMKITRTVSGDEVQQNTFEFLKSYSQDELDKYEQNLFVGQDTFYDDILVKNTDEFSCLRHCGRDFQPKLCYYKFIVERFETFYKTCDACPSIIKHCFNNDCITADGTKMKVLTVNRMLPATAIHVCQSDTLVVDVKNLLPGGRSVSIHWHGIKHKNSQWMDGASFLTQCPINSGQKFRYQFQVSEAGTFFYHASNNEQHVGGLAGPLIVRSAADFEEDELYHNDLYSHTIFIQDLIHENDASILSVTDARGRYLSPTSYLINGRGQYKKSKFKLFEKPKSPFAQFWMEQHRKYRFRIISASNLSCSIRLAFEKHPMIVIATDGNRINQVEVGSVYMFPGERLDVVINASQKIDSYWIRVQGNDFCSSARQSAILNYKGTKRSTPSSKSSKKIFSQFSKSLPDLNNFGLGCENNKKNLCWENLTPSTFPDILRNSKVRAIEIKVAKKKSTSLTLAESPVSKQIFSTVFGRDFLEDVETYNQISCKLPPFAVLKQYYENIPDDLQCDRYEPDAFRECFYVIKIELDEMIDLIFIDVTHKDLPESKKEEKELLSYDRSIHLHGYSVLMLKQGTVKHVSKQNEQPLYSEQFFPPIFKDTFSIPKGGYTVVRFQATNPGIWALETPITDGNDEGVALALQVGDRNFRRSGIFVPPDFPECNDYLPPVNPIHEYSQEGENVDRIQYFQEGNSSEIMVENDNSLT